MSVWENFLDSFVVYVLADTDKEKIIHIWMVNCSVFRAESLRRRIIAETNRPNAKFHTVEVDLADLASIRKAADEIINKNIMLKLLVNAAGLYSPVAGLKSKESLDLAYAVNFVGPVLLMQMLHPLLRKNSPSTVINVTCEQYAKLKKVDQVSILPSSWNRRFTP